MKNTSRERMLQSLIIAGLCIILFLVGSTSISCFEGGCALMFISIFLFFSALAVAGLVFYPMAKVYDDVRNDGNFLAYWKYDSVWYKRIVNREFEEHVERNKSLLIIVDGMILFVAFVFIIFVPDGGVETGFFMFGVAILIYLVATFAPGYYRARKEKMPAEAWIGKKGLIYEGGAYPYSGLMYGCRGVEYREGKEPALVFDFYQMTGGRIYDPFEIVVPVPPGEEEKAKLIVGTLFFKG